VVITTPEVAAVRDADRVIGLLNTQGVQPVQLVLNRVRPKMMSNQEMLSVDDVTDILALPLLGLVFEDEQVIVSTNRGEPLTLSDSSSPAAQAYGNIARRLQGEDVPLMDPSQARRGLRAQDAQADANPDFPEAMTLKEFIDKLLRRQPASAETAKEPAAVGAGPRPQ